MKNVIVITAASRGFWAPTSRALAAMAAEVSRKREMRVGSRRQPPYAPAPDRGDYWRFSPRGNVNHDW
jgi:hypothetical protein